MPPVHVGVLLPARETAMLGRYEFGRLLSFAQQAEVLGSDPCGRATPSSSGRGWSR